MTGPDRGGGERADRAALRALNVRSGTPDEQDVTSDPTACAPAPRRTIVLPGEIPGLEVVGELAEAVTRPSRRRWR